MWSVPVRMLTALAGRPMLACLAVIGVTLAGCGGGGGPMLVSQEQEIAIGREVAQQVESEYGAPLRSGPYVDRMRRVGDRLLRQAKRDVPYSISVLQNSEVVNAFAAPGGPTFVTTALMDLMPDDNELAFVVGHELAHVEEEHGREAINQQALVSTAASVLLKDTSALLQLGAQVMYVLYSQGYSRQNEREADSSGLRLMAAAGYQPRAALEALRKLGGGNLSGPARWLSSHPATPERIERLQAQIDQEYR